MLKKNFLLNWLFIISGFTPIWMLFVNNSVYLTLSDYYEFSLILLIQITFSLAILLFINLINKNNSKIFFFITLNLFIFFLWNDIKNFLIDEFTITSPGTYYYLFILLLNSLLYFFLKKKILKF